MRKTEKIVKRKINEETHMEHWNVRNAHGIQITSEKMLKASSKKDYFTEQLWLPLFVYSHHNEHKQWQQFFPLPLSFSSISKQIWYDNSDERFSQDSPTNHTKPMIHLTWSMSEKPISMHKYGIKRFHPSIFKRFMHKPKYKWTGKYSRGYFKYIQSRKSGETTTSIATTTTTASTHHYIVAYVAE